MGQLLTEMVGSMILDRLGSIPSSERPTASSRLREEAVALIAQRRADPNLSIEDIAAGIPVSSRRLQAVFAEAETSVSAEIRRQRAALAVHLLGSPRYDALRIDEIARHAGFGSALTMRKALQAQHGTTASTLRRRTAVTASGDLEPLG